MKISSRQLMSSLEYLPELNAPNIDADLVIVHGNPYSLEQPRLLENLCVAFPNASIAGCSSSGEIINGETHENSIVYSAIEFEHSRVRQTRVSIANDQEDEFEAGKVLANNLLDDELAFIIVFSEGLGIDCDELLKGANEVLGNKVPLIGGLAADNNAFNYTVVMDREGTYGDAVIAVGIYGKRIKVNHVMSSFDHVGVEVDITSSEGNLVRTLNHKPVLDVYKEVIFKQYDYDIDFIMSHPLVILDPQSKRIVYCRTIFDYDLDSGVVLTAGSVPQGPAKIISLIDSSNIIADINDTCEKLIGQAAEFAFVISCASRKEPMGSEWIKESKFIQECLGNTPSLGFYSFGEIGRHDQTDPAVVHNHTLTIATIIET